MYVSYAWEPASQAFVDEVGQRLPADREEWLAIQDFQHRVSDTMAWVADVLMPRGAESLDAAIERLQS